MQSCGTPGIEYETNVLAGLSYQKVSVLFTFQLPKFFFNSFSQQ